MWEKISDYCLDVSKYFLTAVFVTSMMQDLNDVRWMLYVVRIFPDGFICGFGFDYFFNGRALSEIYTIVEE